MGDYTSDMSRLSALASMALVSLALMGCDRRQEPIPEQWAPTPSLSHQARPLPEGSHEGAGKSLLDEYASRTSRDSAESASWLLPNNGKTIIVEALIAAAHDDAARMLELVTPTATWGIPDRRQLRARPVRATGDPYGLDFIEVFRNAAARFKAKASFGCVPLQPNWSMLAEAGAEPMWCTYNADDGYDLLVFRLVKFRGEVRIDYVGLFIERPTGLFPGPKAGYIPPPTPYVKLDPSDLPKPMLGRDPGGRARPQPRVRPAAPSGQAPIPVQADRQPDRPITVPSR